MGTRPGDRGITPPTTGRAGSARGADLQHAPLRSRTGRCPGTGEGDLLLRTSGQLHRHFGRAAVHVRDARQDPRPCSHSLGVVTAALAT